jgi:hypothetical protein
MPEELVRDFLEEFSVLRQDRTNWEEVWEEIAENVVPHRTGFEQEKPEQGQRRGQEIYDGTAISALNLFASGSQGYLLSSSFKWFGLRVPQEQLMDVREVRLWLSMVEEILYGLIQRSNFYKQMYELFRDGGSFGTATMYTDFDLAARTLNFRVIHPREIYIAENNEGEVDTVFHYSWMTHRKIVQEFGEGNVDGEVLKAADEPGRKYSELPVLRVVRPRPGWDPNKMDARSKKYGSYYIDVENQKLMREGGHDVLPYAVWRLEKGSDETYGRGPGWTALADIKSLQQYAETDITAAQLMVNPPLDVPQEREGEVLWIPGGRSYYDDASREVKMMQTNVNLRAGLEREERKQRIIEKHFLVDFFLLMAQADREMTATEIRRRQEEKAVILGPYINGLNQDVLDKVIDRIFNQAWEIGMIPPPPPILAGGHIEVDYMGPLAQAQRAFFHAEPYRQSIGDILGIVQMRPDVMDNYDWDYMTREMSKSNGLPEEAMLEEKVVQKIRAIRAEQQRMQQEMAAMEQMGKAAPGLNEPVKEGSVLEGIGEAAGPLPTAGATSPIP